MAPLAEAPIRNILSVDVEEYFHPTEVQTAIHTSQWELLPSRIEAEVNVVLELLEDAGVQATFFILGWIAEQKPSVVRAIHAAGHEIGCHSFSHQLVYSLTPAQFREDTRRAVAAIVDACGATPRVYRAPSYSITGKSMWALEVLIECGFTQDSSIYPIAHDRYGIQGFPRYPHTVDTPSGPIYEVPIATVKLANGRIAPIGGGGYLRLLPYRYTAAGIRRLNHTEGHAGCIYFHPWELDPDQPHLARGYIARLRTYTGMGGMRHKIRRLLSEFDFGPFHSVAVQVASAD
jgi:polysaccharide deacetylase family protein (PEP-CTERM system associated)